MNLTDPQSIERALEGAQYVVHTASPVGANPKNHDDMIRPAVDGINAMLRAATQHHVKRVVITSSCSAVSAVAAKDRPPGNRYTEASWSDVKAMDKSAYTKSKTLQERAIWAFKETHADCPEIVTLCPSLILGEVIAMGEQTSAAIVKKAINRDIPGFPAISFTGVNVKDCALAHVRALERPEAANKRFILSEGQGHTYPDLARWLDEGLKERGYNYNIPTWQVPNWMIGIGSWFSSDLDSIYFLLDEPPKFYDNSRSKEILGIEYGTTPKQMILELAESLIKSGQVPLKRADASK